MVGQAAAAQKDIQVQHKKQIDIHTTVYKINNKEARVALLIPVKIDF